MSSKKKSVLVGGCFDILHIGHVRFLQKAKLLGDWLIVALESDEFIRNKKGKEPFHTVDEREEILLAIKYVDEVIVLPEMKSDEDYFNLVKKVSPSVIAVTENDPYIGKKISHAEKVGAEVIPVIGMIDEKSSSEILKREFISIGNKYNLDNE